MKKLRCSPGNLLNKKIACTVSAAALMLGVSSAATVGLHFECNYCTDSAYTGFPVTMTAFGIETNGWENLLPMDTGYGCTPDQLSYTTNELIDATTSTNGLNPLPNGSLSVTWTANSANYSGFYGYGDTGFAPPPAYSHPDTPPPNPIPSGESEVYLTFLRDGLNFGPPGGPNNDLPDYLIDVTGLKSLFTNSQYVVELIGSGDSIETLTNAYVIEVTDTVTNSVSYPNTPLPNNTEGSSYYQGSGGGLSTATGALDDDHIQIMSAPPQHVAGEFNHAGTISGFIVTDKPVFTMSPRSVFGRPGDTVVLNPYAIGVPPLSYQWRVGGVPIPNATNASYTIAGVSLANAGNYDLLVANAYGETTSLVAAVTTDVIAQSPAAETVADSNPANAENDGTDLGATWLASSSDGTTTRNGVMDFDAAETNGISVTDSANLQSATGTVSFWMRSSGVNFSLAGAVGAPLVCQAQGLDDDFIIYQADGGNIGFQTPPTSPANTFASAGGVSDDKWHFVAVTFDQSAAGGAAVFIDGALDTTNSNGAAWSWEAAQPLTIGYTTDPTWYSYTGLLNDVRFYSAELSAAEISSIYTSDALADTNALEMDLSFSTPPVTGITLSWQETTAVLQSAPTVSGPWKDEPAGASSPYTIVPSATQQYFRFRFQHTPQTVESNPYLM
jgi:hypothetical protein